MDLVRAQARIEWVLFEYFPSPADGIFLSRSEAIEAFPEAPGGLVQVFHSRCRCGGLAPLNTFSISPKRPASASAIPCLNSSGIHESSVSTTNLATRARSSEGRPLIC